jgi:8-oxo-dGTP pyrophosphatase MutT (NUDIX family)
MHIPQLRLDLQDDQWPLDYIDHDRQIARAIVVDNEGDFYFMRVERWDEFAEGALMETSGGGVEPGEDLHTAILRELKEELGVTASPEDLHYIGKHRGSFQAPFHGRMFRDNELSNVYVITKYIDESRLRLQESEVESVMWMDYETCRRQIHEGTLPNCIYEDEFDMVGEYLKQL